MGGACGKSYNKNAAARKEDSQRQINQIHQLQTNKNHKYRKESVA